MNSTTDDVPRRRSRKILNKHASLLFLSALFSSRQYCHAFRPSWQIANRHHHHVVVEKKQVQQSPLSPPILQSTINADSATIEQVSIWDRIQQKSGIVSGAVFSTLVIVFLALSNDDSSVNGDYVDLDSTGEDALGMLSTASASTLQLVADKLQTLSSNIVDAAVPLTTTDVVAVGLGEGIAGMVGASASFALSSLLLMGNEKADRSSTLSSTTDNTDTPVNKSLSFFTLTPMDSTQLQQQKSIMTNQSTMNGNARQALADGDFLLARAGVSSFLATLGIPTVLTQVASDVIAIVPYQLVKFGQRRREFLMEENMELERLLKVQQRQERSWLPSWLQRKDNSFSSTTNETSQFDPETLKPVREAKDILAIEVFSDLTKWLEYDVLSSTYGGELSSITGLAFSTAAEGALFGAVAAVSSQVYADVLYAYFGWGGPAIQQAVLTRTTREWATILISRCIYAATLFGVYEWVQEPTMSWLSALLSGGVDSCVGSEDFTLCVDTFVKKNPQAVGSSFESEFRAFVTSFYSFYNRVMANL